MSSAGSNAAIELDVWAIDRGTQRLIDHALRLGPVCTFTVCEGAPMKITRKEVRGSTTLAWSTEVTAEYPTASEQGQNMCMQMLTWGLLRSPNDPCMSCRVRLIHFQLAPAGCAIASLHASMLQHSDNIQLVRNVVTLHRLA